MHDLQVVLRGTEQDIGFAIQELSKIDCDIETIRSNRCLVWKANPGFTIFRSASSKALNSGVSDDKNDNKSARSESTKSKHSVSNKSS